MSALAEYKCEEALQQLLQAQSDIAALISAGAGSESPFNVYTGIDDGAVDYDCVLVQAASTEPLGPLIGNWVVNVSVKIITRMNVDGQGKAEHYARIGYVQAVIMSDALQSEMNSKVADLAVGELMMKGRTTAVNNDCWIHETQLAIPCRDGA
jgi:hypothetical protein